MYVCIHKHKNHTCPDDQSMPERMYVCIHVYTHIYIDVCMYVCMYVYTNTKTTPVPTTSPCLDLQIVSVIDAAGIKMCHNVLTCFHLDAIIQSKICHKRADMLPS